MSPRTLFTVLGDHSLRVPCHSLKITAYLNPLAFSSQRWYVFFTWCYCRVGASAKARQGLGNEIRRFALKNTHNYELPQVKRVHITLNDNE